MAILTGDNNANELNGGNEIDVLLGLGGNDRLNGNDNNDFLYGGDGKDVLFGNGGNDFLDGGNGNDLLFGDASNDTLLGGLGKDFLQGGNGDDLLFGGNDDDFLSDAVGSNRLDGGLGNDFLSVAFFLQTNHILTGGFGADTFRLGVDGSNTGIAATQILDFSPTDDTIALDGFGFNGGGDPVFLSFDNGEIAVNQETRTLSPDQFTIGATATTAAQRIIYNQGTGTVFFDRDGIGGAQQTAFLQLNPFLNLTNNDFVANLAA